jgi:hypothetical protein
VVCPPGSGIESVHGPGIRWGAGEADNTAAFPPVKSERANQSTNHISIFPHALSHRTLPVGPASSSAHAR